jgi:hypothetical protein
MGRKKGIHPVLIAGGVVVIVVAFLIFVPAILGATASGSDLEKYNGTSQQGNDTVRIASVVNNYLVTVTGLPLTVAAYATVLFVFVAVVLWVLRSTR